MPQARLQVEVDGEAGQDVNYLLAANPGSPPRPLVKVASGGELARTMLALRLVLTAAPPTLIFDEVDAGVGGAAATAVGRALASLATDHQVLVVTHLPQVAAWAGVQVGISKREVDAATVTEARVLAGRRSRDRAGADALGFARQHHGAAPRGRAAGRFTALTCASAAA